MVHYHFCTDCEYIKKKMVTGLKRSAVKEMSCPARFNPREGKWMPVTGANPHKCPRNENVTRIYRLKCSRKYLDNQIISKGNVNGGN
jgi:hypothetical protein